MDPSDCVQPGTGADHRGAVTFLDGATPLGTVQVTPFATPVTQGSARLVTAALRAGRHSLTAKYDGDVTSSPFGFFFTTGSTSPAVTETVNPAVAADVTPLMSVTTLRLPNNQALVLVRNKTGRAIGAPLYLEVTGLPATVGLLGRSGFTVAHGPPHSPFVSNNVTLLPGGFV